MGINNFLQRIYKLTKWLLMVGTGITLFYICAFLMHALSTQQHSFNLIVRLDQYMQHSDKVYCDFAKEWETNIKPYLEQRNKHAKSKNDYYFAPINIKETTNDQIKN